MRHFNSLHLTRRLAPLVVLAAASATASASTFERITFTERVERAELIVQGVVTAVEHRNSDITGPGQVVLPHTFVTIQIEQVFKGASANGDRITLRMQGGPDGKGRFLQVIGVPRFSPGDRDILFIHENGASICPIVGWEQGRLRVVRGQVYDDFGQETWITPDGDLVLGEKKIDVRRAPYAELDARPDDDERGSGFVAPVGAVRPDANGLAAILDQVTGELAAMNPSVATAPTPSMNIGATFHVDAFLPAPPPVDPVSKTEPKPKPSSESESEQKN